MGWDDTGINCYGMGQKNMSHGQAWILMWLRSAFEADFHSGPKTKQKFLFG